ncbi:MAG: SDR family oxidoreductase [Polyangiaceae bacterium]|nr:SDR family oxidoreductase [Polyangiaceae bacterium]
MAPAARKLEGRRIVLTGASRGVGYETTKRFLAEGARIIGVGKDAARLARAAEVFATLGDFSGLSADLCDPTAAERIATAVRDRWGALDVLFSNAAILIHGGGAGSFEDEASGTLERTLETNLLSPFRLTAALLPLLRRGTEPRIVHVGSGAGTFEGVHLGGIASYRLSKWALHGLAMLQATHLAGKIAVNTFDPGWVKTDLGGPDAPGSPIESAEGALAVVTLPFEVTGKLWKDGGEIAY